MNDCGRFEPTIQAYIAGELDESALGPVLGHCRDCRECRSLLEMHRDLAGLAFRASEPDPQELESMRHRVLARTRPARPVWRTAAAVAAALLLFVIGLAVGRGGSAGGDGNVVDRLVTAIDAEAASNRVLSDVEDSRFTFSNVSFRREPGDRVALDFDVTTHVALVEPVGSELVGEVLVQSLLNSSTVGARLKAMTYASGSMKPKVMEALIFAMRRDENLAVRLQALSVLSDQLAVPAVEAAVLERLRVDESVQMRLLALDYLAGYSADHDRIREVIQESDRPGDEALKVRLARYTDGGV